MFLHFQVVQVIIVRDKYTGQRMGYSFVHFCDVNSKSRAGWQVYTFEASTFEFTNLEFAISKAGEFGADDFCRRTLNVQMPTFESYNSLFY